MYEIGELVTYGSHGVCKIGDITEESFGEEMKSYYILHPTDQPTLTIYCPVDSSRSTLKNIVSKEKAKLLLDCFSKPADNWIERHSARFQSFNSTIKTGNPLNIASLVNTLSRKEIELENNGKKLSSQDFQVLQQVRQILFEELALSLSTTTDTISDRVHQLISQSTDDSNAALAE